MLSCILDFLLNSRSQIFIAVYSLHRSPRYWEEPDTFDPKRFLRPYVNPDEPTWKGFDPKKHFVKRRLTIIFCPKASETSWTTHVVRRTGSRGHVVFSNASLWAPRFFYQSASALCDL